MKKMTDVQHMSNLAVILDLSLLEQMFLGKNGKPTKTKTKDAVLHEACVHISNGNNKIGKCYNWSVTPLKSCTTEACATCGKEGCYATSSYRQYDDCRIAWDENLLWVLFNVRKWGRIMMMWFNIVRPDKFRVHVAGDFATLDYALMWKKIMIANPYCQYFAFTKQWDIVRQAKFYEVPNFRLRLSAWTGIEIPEDLMEYYDVAWVDDGIETRIPKTAYQCPGNCDQCNYFCAYQSGDTYFIKHGSDLQKGIKKTKARLARKAA